MQINERQRKITVDNLSVVLLFLSVTPSINFQLLHALHFLTSP